MKWCSTRSFSWYLGVTNSLPGLGEGCAGPQVHPSHPQLIDSCETFKKTLIFSLSVKTVLKKNGVPLDAFPVVFRGN